MLSEYTVRRRAMAESFLRSQQFELESAAGSLTGSSGKESISLSFDAQGRISEIRGTPSSPGEKALVAALEGLMTFEMTCPRQTHARQLPLTAFGAILVVQNPRRDEPRSVP
jgi:hypothetical protein